MCCTPASRSIDTTCSATVGWAMRALLGSRRSTSGDALIPSARSVKLPAFGTPRRWRDRGGVNRVRGTRSPAEGGVLPGDLGAQPCVVLHQRDVGGQAGAAGDLHDAAQEEWGGALAVYPAGRHVGQCLLDDVVDLSGGDLVLGLDRSD